MLSVYQIKPAFQRLLKPVLVKLHASKVTANQITWSAIILSLLIGIAFWFADVNRLLFLALPVGLLIRMALNALDGMMARTYNQQSKSGEVLNEVGDIVSDFFIFFPLVKFEHHHIYLIVIFLMLSILNEFSGLLGKAVSGTRRYEGPMGKSDRAFMISLYGILMCIGFGFEQYTFWFFLLLVLLLLWSTYLRIHKTLLI